MAPSSGSTPSSGGPMPNRSQKCPTEPENKPAVTLVTPKPPLEERLSKKISRLEKANARLRQTGNLRADLTHMIIHDLKGPLAEIIANLNLLEQEPLTPTQTDYLRSAVLGTDDLLRMVQNILEIYRLETKKKMVRSKVFNPRDAVEGVVERLTALKTVREASIHVHCNDSSHPLLADKDLFERIVLNLFVNAIEHSRPGSQIGVDLSWSEDFKRLQVSVSDEGPGIKKSDRKRVFQRFYSARHGSVSGHSGLGLPFCKLAVEAHRGKIWVEDCDGSGSRFLFYIPNGLSRYLKGTQSNS